MAEKKDKKAAHPVTDQVSVARLIRDVQANLHGTGAEERAAAEVKRLLILADALLSELE